MNPFPKQNIATMFTMQNKNAEALKELNELIQLEPEFIDAYVQRGFIYNSDNQKEQAKKDFETVLELNSKTKILPPELVQDLKDKIKEIKKKK